MLLKSLHFSLEIKDQKEGDRINCTECFSDIITVNPESPMQ